MRTLELHAPVKQISRSSGRSSVAAAAYRSGSQLFDERTGEWHDYTQKQGVEYSRIYAPDNAPTWAQDRAALWNAVEVKENRSNSSVAHELEFSLPFEFNPMQRREAGDAVARELQSRYGGVVDLNHHAPNGQGDPRNFHAHIMFTTRSLDPETKDGWSRTKFRDLSQDKITIDGEATTKGREEILSLRAFLADQLNRIAERDGLEVRTEHLSFEQRGIDREPTQHLGPKASDMERQGKGSDRGDRNREIEAANDNADLYEREAEIIDLEIEREKRRLVQERELDQLSLAKTLAETYGQQQRDAELQMQYVQSQLDNQNIFQRFWFGLSGHNSRLRDELEALDQDRLRIEAERQAAEAEVKQLADLQAMQENAARDREQQAEQVHDVLDSEKKPSADELLQQHAESMSQPAMTYDEAEAIIRQSIEEEQSNEQENDTGREL